MTKKLNLTSEELKGICSQFQMNDDDFLTLDDRTLLAKEIMSRLSPSDFAILSLYLEYQSQRKVGEILGVSKTPIATALQKIKEEIELIKQEYDN